MASRGAVRPARSRPASFSSSATSSRSLTPSVLEMMWLGSAAAPKRRCSSAAVSQDLQLALRELAVSERRRAQRARDVSSSQQQRRALVLAERRVAAAVGTAPSNSSADDLLVHAAVLAQVERRQVEAEDLHGRVSDARSRPRAIRPARLRREGIRDDLEIAHEFRRVGIGSRRARSPRAAAHAWSSVRGVAARRA